MSLFPYQYPEDLTGTAVRNLVTNEVRTFASNPERIFIPTGGPYFTDSLRVVNTATGLELEPLTQYTCLHLHTEGTMASGAQVCTVILIKDTTVLSVTLEYQAIGGQYGEVVTTIKQIVENANLEFLEKVSWGSQIYGKPETYPATAHRHPGGEFGDWKRFHMALNNIYQAIIHKDTGAWQAVYAYVGRCIDIAIENNRLSNQDYYTKTEINNIVASNSNRVNVKTVTTSYTPTTSELVSNLLLRVDTTAKTSTVTLPNVGTTVPVGSVTHISQINQHVVIQPASGVSILPVNNLDMLQVGILASLVYLGEDKWDIFIYDTKLPRVNAAGIRTLLGQTETPGTGSNSGGIGEQIVASINYQIDGRGPGTGDYFPNNYTDMPGKFIISGESGYSFLGQTPTSFSNPQSDSNLQGTKLVDFVVTLPAEYDPAEHRVEVFGTNLFTVSGRTVTIALKYDYLTYRYTYNNKTWSRYFPMLATNIQINIVSKDDTGAGSVVIDGAGQLAATVNYRITSRDWLPLGSNSPTITPGKIEVHDANGFSFLGHTPELLSNTKYTESNKTDDHHEDFVVTLPAEYDPAEHRVEVFGGDSYSLSGNEVTITLPFYLRADTFSSLGPVNKNNLYRHLDTCVRINLITIN